MNQGQCKHSVIMSVGTDSSYLEDGVRSISGKVIRSNVDTATLWIMKS